MRVPCNIIAIFLFALSAYPQTNVQTAGKETNYIGVSVVSKTGDFILGLAAENFSLFENGRPQSITDFVVNEPACVGILLDTSATFEFFDYQKFAALLGQDLRYAKPEDELVLIAFNETQSVLLDRTSDSGEKAAGVDRISYLVSKGHTKLYDSIEFALGKLAESKYRKKALIVLTDLDDNASKVKSSSVKESIKNSDVQFYGIGMKIHRLHDSDRIPAGRDPDPLDPAIMMDQIWLEQFTGLSDVSGGLFFRAKDYAELGTALRQIIMDMDRQYLIGFRNSGGGKVAEWRKVEIKLDPRRIPDIKKVGPNIRVRKGYYLPAISK